MMKIIDPHLHLFDLQKGQYHWLKGDQEPKWPDKHIINKDFAESDLLLTSPLQLAGFVHIEAGFDNTQPWREIDWLEIHCQKTFRSVAFTDISSRDFTQTLDKLLKRPSVCGIRHILDNKAVKLLGNERTQQNLQLLAFRHLSFDAQLSLTDSAAVTLMANILSHNPQLKVIINHGGWPPACEESAQWTVWRDNLNLLSQYDNVAIKLSGWEMANRQWRIEDVVPILNCALQIMGEHRVMLASNFPLCLWRSSYQQLWLDYSTALGENPPLLNLLCHDNAAHWYKLSENQE